MHALLMSVILTAAAPVILRIEMTDALRFPSGKESPPADPLTIYVKAPASWVHKGGLSDAGKTAVLAKMYGGPGWMNGNSDGSTYVVKTFTSKVLKSAGEATDGKSTWWYEVKPDGSIEKRGANFGDPAAPKEPASLIDHAEKGSVFKQGPKIADAKALRAWLDAQKVDVKLPVTLKRGQVGFSSNGAKVGGLTLRCDDTALGISLADRAEEHCKGQPECTLWLVGTWKAHATEPVLAVTKVAGVPNAVIAGDHAWFNEPN